MPNDNIIYLHSSNLTIKQYRFILLKISEYLPCIQNEERGMVSLSRKFISALNDNTIKYNKSYTYILTSNDDNMKMVWKMENVTVSTYAIDLLKVTHMLYINTSSISSDNYGVITFWHNKNVIFVVRNVSEKIYNDIFSFWCVLKQQLLSYDTTNNKEE